MHPMNVNIYDRDEGRFTRRDKRVIVYRDSRFCPFLTSHNQLTGKKRTK